MLDDNTCCSMFILQSLLLSVRYSICALTCCRVLPAGYKQRLYVCNDEIFIMKLLAIDTHSCSSDLAMAYDHDTDIRVQSCEVCQKRDCAHKAFSPTAASSISPYSGSAPPMCAALALGLDQFVACAAIMAVQPMSHLSAIQ